MRTNGYTVFEGGDPVREQGGPRQAADPFVPLLAATVAPALSQVARAGIRRLLPVARRAAVDAVKALAAPEPAVAGSRPTDAAAPRPGPRRYRSDRARLRAIARRIERIRQILADGDARAVAAESALLGGSAESAAGPNPEAVLAEVLAAEAAHANELTEASALLGAALPSTIRAMGAARVCRPYLPELASSNVVLVRALHGRPGGPDVLRLMPSIHRRTVGSLMAAHRRGRPVPASHVPTVMAGHAVGVLTRPAVAGPAIARNLTLRRNSVAAPTQHGRREQ